MNSFGKSEVKTLQDEQTQDFSFGCFLEPIPGTSELRGVGGVCGGVVKGPGVGQRQH